MASATAVARYLETKQVFGRVHLQKLVYYSQAWALTWSGRPLFEEEILAWEGGPVTPSVWDQQRYGDLSLERTALSSPEELTVDAVYAHYGAIPGTRLSRMTHNEAPWRDAWADGRGRNSVISKAAMRRAYTEQALLAPSAAPRPPVLVESVGRDELLAAAAVERDRWRSLLDHLASE